MSTVTEIERIMGVVLSVSGGRKLAWKSDYVRQR
jgi:hypothetical protein